MNEHDDNGMVERVTDRIRKLMALAGDDGATTGEINAALKQARRMMDKYQIAEESIIVDEPDARETAFQSMCDVEGWRRSGKMELQDLTLATGIARLCDCSTFTRQFWGTNQRKNKTWMQSVHFYGMQHDVAVCTALYHEIFLVMRTMARARYGPKYGKLHRSYMTGFANGVWRQVCDLKSTPSTDDAGTTAIVVCKDALLRRYDAEHLQLAVGAKRKVRASAFDERARLSGLCDGRAVSLATKVVKGDADNDDVVNQLG